MASTCFFTILIPARSNKTSERVPGKGHDMSFSGSSRFDSESGLKLPAVPEQRLEPATLPRGRWLKRDIFAEDQVLEF